jgi:hypothetical protein
MSSERFEQAELLNLRIEQVVDLASLLGTDSMEDVRWPDQFDDIESSLDNDRSFFGKAQELLPALRASEEAWEVSECLREAGFLGLLVRCATPIREYSSETSWRSGWGHYTTCWVYGNTFEDAWADAMLWAQSRHADMLAKSLKKGGAA